MERIGVVIPIFSKTLVPAVLSGPHGMFGTFVNIKHFPSIFSQFAVEHLAGTDGSSAIWIILIANGDHLRHMLLADRFVAALVENDAGVVPVVNDCIPHQLHPLLPSATLYVSFCITSRHSL
ncbi:hypothetical protein SDC9_155253 [bioreactor metagenome]|uniref:Uncharacterized protein n=1 Tax=bioreactor metagenome TaxID=1076179 RepID=A0A645F1A2_9ZZZZ